MPPAYYNEFEPYAAAWLRRLIAAGHIAPGDVDERSIADVQPDDLRGYAQCHFFAGIGGWSYAARLAGWPDDQSMWTGSCPCQPFSVAGKGKGAADERHLWPVWFRLIRECRPATVFGEQVAAAVGKGWLDGVFADLEEEGYACGSAIVPACAVDAPHRRDRLWFVADSGCGRWGSGAIGGSAGAWIEGAGGVAERGSINVADSDLSGLAFRQGVAGDDGAERSAAERGGGDGTVADHAAPGEGRRRVCGPGESGSEDHQRTPGQLAGPCGGAVVHDPCVGRGEGRPEHDIRSGWPASAGAGVSGGGHWSRYVWITGADGKARRVGTRKPQFGVRELVDGVPDGVAGLRADEEAEIIPLLSVGEPARIGKLRAFGNAIVPQVAAEVIAAYMETCE